MASIDLLFQGFPGWSPDFGRLGWPSISLIRAGDRNVLFDTGHPGMHRLLLRRLADRGLSPDDVHMVVMSHSHWDHTLGLPLFPRAELVIGQVELEWALKVAPAEEPSVPGYLVQYLADQPRLTALRGDTELLPGVRMIDTPGHTPGHMSMLVETEEGTVAIAQDAVKNRAEFLARSADQTMDAAASAASIERIAAVARVVIPGHDRAFRLENGRPQYLAELKMEILIKSSPSMGEETVLAVTLR